MTMLKTRAELFSALENAPDDTLLQNRRRTVDRRVANAAKMLAVAYAHAGRRRSFVFKYEVHR